ncbi:MAG: hypothetical protein M3Y48_25370 [Actinomycetota bacterium]|nr:hypothetical protein [Actinomycetota bacterium]
MKRPAGARDLASALHDDLFRASRLADEFARACDRTLACIGDQALAVARARARANAHARAVDLLKTFERNRDRVIIITGVRYRNWDLASARDRAVTFISDLASVRDRERVRDLASDLASARDRARGLASDLRGSTALARDLADMFDRGLTDASDYAVTSIRALTSDPDRDPLRQELHRALYPYEQLGAALHVTRALDLDFPLNLGVDLALNRPVYVELDPMTPARILNAALDLNFALDRAAENAAGLHRIRNRAWELESALDFDLAHSIRSAAQEVEAVTDGVDLKLGRVSGGLIALAVQMLPASQRPSDPATARSSALTWSSCRTGRR